MYTLATGVVRTWTGNGTIGVGADDARSLSWTDQGRTLAFDWEPAGPGVHVGVWLLDTGASGSDLIADSRQAVSLLNQSSVNGLPSSPPVLHPSPGPVPQPTCQQDSIITPDGSAIVCGAIAAVNQQLTATGLKRGAVTEFREYATATGKVTRILGHWTYLNVGALAVGVLWSNASGRVLIGVIPTAGDGRVGVISGNTFTPLPWSAALSGTW